MFELNSAFATEEFCGFWKSISPRIFHSKSQTYSQALQMFVVDLCLALVPPLRKVVCSWWKMFTMTTTKNKILLFFFSYRTLAPWVASMDINFLFGKITLWLCRECLVASLLWAQKIRVRRSPRKRRKVRNPPVMRTLGRPLTNWQN